MRLPTLSRLALALTGIALGTVGAQTPATNASGNGANAAANPLALLPFGATSDKPVSKWTPPASAGRQLTLNDLLTWKSVRTPALSNDGKWFAYGIGPAEGDAEVVLRNTAANGKEYRFPVGDAGAGGGGRGGGGGGIGISGNNKWAAFLVNASSATAGRGGRGGGRGAAPGGAAPAAANTPAKLAVVNLADGTKREFENVRAFRFAGDKSDVIAVYHNAPRAAGGAAGGAGAAPAASAAPAGSTLELVNLADGSQSIITDVSEYAFDDSGDWIALAISTSDQVGNSLQLRQISTSVTRTLNSSKATYRRIIWGDSSDALAALKVMSDTAGGDEDATVMAWSHAGSAAKPLEITSKSAGISGGLVISSDRALEFGDGERVIYFGLREPRPPRPRAGGAGFTPPNPGGTAPGAGAGGQVAAAPQTDAEVPSLILWHWKDARPQAQQQVQEAQDKAFSYLAAFHVGASKVVQLTDNRMRDITVGPKDSWGVGSDVADYERDAGIRGFAYRDVYAVNVNTGERKLIQKKVPGGAGGGGRGGGASPAFAPDNGRYAYYDTGEWKLYDFATGSAKTITTGIPTKFWNTEDDHNQVKPAIPGALIGWTKDGTNLFVRDNWDVWRIPTSGGAAMNITGNGAKDQIKYQNRLLFDPRDRGGIDPSKPLYFETYGEWTKKEGLVQVDPIKGGAKTITFENAKVDYRRARDADTWVFARQTVVKYPDWYAADAGITNERRLTDANPQQKEIAWTPGAQLVEYTCDNNGGKHQGVLYLPAGYEKGKKYPMLTYIYEKLSQEYNAYTEPNATRYSNPSVYTSRGYAFFKPDIVYKINEPGRSAVWCVVPAVKAAIATGIVDADRVGLQGHSWGGYQTTFITTQTNIFKTAVAGAPLTDMVSMFGSMYWNTGSTDASIFISSQGRFTGGPNDVPDAYMRNSPQNFAQNLNIPFMILHNDRDGAVDFNQGITYYNHLRQLGKDVVLLEYVGENHGLARPANQKDYNLRMTEWFDTFLRDQPAPEWLKEGVPRLKMEQHLKDRRVMVDPKATVTAPRITP
jgi:dipeptidyl aminopeptidase/acylaminoacyl peptidase